MDYLAGESTQAGDRSSCSKSDKYMSWSLLGVHEKALSAKCGSGLFHAASAPAAPGLLH